MQLKDRDRRRRHKSILHAGVLLLCLLAYDNAISQASYLFHQIRQSDGLMHTSIRTVVQDKTGYIWILSTTGLQRYDGSRFVNYAYDINTSGGIKDTRTAALFSDPANNCLWIVDKEIQRFDLLTERFTSYDNNTLRANRSFAWVRYKDSLNNDWFLGKFGVICDRPFRDVDALNLSAYPFSPHRNDILAADSAHGETWLITYYQGLLLFDQATKRVYTHAYNPIHHPLLTVFDKKQLIAILKDSYDNIWIATNKDKFYRYDPAAKKLYEFSLADITSLKGNRMTNNMQFVECMLEDNRRNLWLGIASAGVLKFDRNANRFLKVTDESSKQEGLFYNYDVQSIFQDRDENIWLSTDKGISIFNPYRQLFSILRHEDSNDRSLPKEEIQCFIRTRDGDLLVGTWGGGIAIYDSSLNFKKTIRFDGPVDYNLIWTFIQHDDGTVWAGCQHGYIHIYDPRTQKIRTIHPPELHNYTIHSMAKDKEGNIWIGLHDGKVAEWRKADQRFYPYNEQATDVPPSYDGALNIFFDSDDRCWVSTDSGLKEFDTQTRQYKGFYQPQSQKANVVSANSMQGIAEYKRGTLLVGSLHGGLYLFDKEKKSFEPIQTTNRLPSNTVFAVDKDRQGNFLISTDYALYQFDPVKRRFHQLAIPPGVLNAGFNNVHFYQLQNGKWLTSTATELIGFLPGDFNVGKEGGDTVEITGLRIFDSAVNVGTFTALGLPLKLNHRQNFLTVEFASLHFDQAPQNYLYKLSGVNADWVRAGSREFASFTNLQPGTYVFSVQAENGGSRGAITSFRIIIAPPFWRTWWFVSCSILIVAGIAFMIVRRRFSRVKRQLELKQKLTDTEMMALRSQMNPHFIFNCLNAIDNLIQTNQPDRATTYLARFAKLMRYLLDSSKNNLISFARDFEILELYLQLEQFRASGKFSYSIEADKALMNGDYKVPPLIIQPFVENAIQHGLLNKESGDRKLVIKVLLQANHILYKISDNGIGRSRAMEIKQRNKPGQKSYGTEISSERIHLHNQNGLEGVTISDIEDGEQRGTEVSVKLKIL